MSNIATLSQEAQKNVTCWLEGVDDPEVQEEILRQLREDPQAIEEAFYRQLAFGTGGLRAIVGIGTNRMNRYTVMRATKGLALYLKQQIPERPLRVIIGYDSRNSSQDFAWEAARVLAYEDIEAHLFASLRPTPLISFGCRERSCHAAIVITASHNPPEYNGYKVYWSDGGQVVPPHDKGIIVAVEAVQEPLRIAQSPKTDPHIHLIHEEIDQAYFRKMERMQLTPQDNQREGKTLRILFSPLHGTGGTLLPELLQRWGFPSLSFVEAQREPNGNFPTVKSPNPEKPEALKLGTEQLLSEELDLFLATDPDADRLGVVVRHEGTAYPLNGNQIACLCFQHILAHMQLPKEPAIIKTIVTTELLSIMAKKYQVACLDVLTGFKYIAEKIHEWEQQKDSPSFLFGGEESFGYLFGTETRDKDAIISSALLSEAALQAKLAGKSLVDRLYELYREYGVYQEQLYTQRFAESQEGHEKIAAAMKRARENPPTHLGGKKVMEVIDYEGTTDLPKSNVLRYRLEDQSSLVVRPSGTEPLVKYYVGVCLPFADPVEKVIAKANKQAAALAEEIQGLMR